MPPVVMVAGTSDALVDRDLVDVRPAFGVDDGRDESGPPAATLNSWVWPKAETCISPGAICVTSNVLLLVPLRLSTSVLPLKWARAGGAQVVANENIVTGGKMSNSCVELPKM